MAICIYKDGWDKALVIFTLIMALATMVTAIAGIWTSHETRNLVNYQIELLNLQKNPDIFFNAETITRPNILSGEYQYINYSIFKNNSFITVQVINKGFKALNLRDVVIYGSCLYWYNASNIRVVISPSSMMSTTLKSGESYKFNTTSVAYMLESNVTLPCEINFILNSDVDAKIDKIIIIDDLYSTYSSTGGEINSI